MRRPRDRRAARPPLPGVLGAAARGRRGEGDAVRRRRRPHGRRPGVLEAIADADAVVFCPSNPVVSIGPILAVPGVRDAVAARRDRSVGVSGIVAGGPVAGMADKLMPAAGIEVTAAGVARHYRDLLSAWVLDDVDAHLAPAVEAARRAVRVVRHDHGGRRARRGRGANGAGSAPVTLSVIPVDGLPEIGAGDDLAASAARAPADARRPRRRRRGPHPEGRVEGGGQGGRRRRPRPPSIAAETRRVVARRGPMTIAETRHGFVCANAGVDASNVAEGLLTLLPEDPDASAERIRAQLAATLGLSELAGRDHRHVRPAVARGPRRRRDRRRGTARRSSTSAARRTTPAASSR